LKRTLSIYKMTAAALLIGVGIAIPMFSYRIVIGPASFTLGSHIAVILSMFISPAVAAAVAVGTALGFFLGGFDPVIVLRASMHLIFALIGSLILKKHPQILAGTFKLLGFSFFVGVIHAISEVAAVTLFYSLGTAGLSYFNQDYIKSVLLLVGVGTLVHSMIDFSIAWLIYTQLIRAKEMKRLFISQ